MASLRRRPDRRFGKVSFFSSEGFISIAAKKTAAAKIPFWPRSLIAMTETDLIKAWVEFHDVLGCWHQMWNDMRDWAADERNGIVTYFLSEDRRVKHQAETMAEWVIREGYDWGLAMLDCWMREMKDRAAEWDHQDLADYLAQRDELERRGREEVQVGLQNLARNSSRQSRCEQCWGY